MRSNLLLSLGLGALILGSCGSTGAGNAPSRAEREFGMEAVLSREFARVEPEVLARIAVEGTAAERERAAYALGRFAELDAESRAGLRAACEDEDELVRAAAAYSMGIWNPHWASLNASVPESSLLVRERRMEGYARVEDDLAISVVLRGLVHEEVLSPGELHVAVIGTSRMDISVEEGYRVDEILIDMLQELASTEAARREVERGDEIETVWRILFALQRRNTARLAAIKALDGETTLDPHYETNAWARASFLLWARSTDARARIYAVQGLGTLEYDETITGELHHALNDNDWRVVSDACVALGKEVTQENLKALIVAAKHANPHVRHVAIEALSEYVEMREQISRILDATNADASSSVQAAAIVTAAKLYGDHSAAQLELKRLKQDPVIRAGVAEAARYLSFDFALPMIKILARDSDLRVAGFALESLGSHKTDESRALLREYLQHEDNGLRLMALLALKEMLTADDLPYLRRAFENTTGDNIADEFRFNVVKAAGTIVDKESALILMQAEGCEHDYTRHLAQEQCEMLNMEITSCFGEEDDVPGELLQLPDELIALAAAAENPFVRVETTRGTMVFELFPRETPFHVYNFIELARRGHYDGLDFHRVVPNFVIQGGDTRGDGNGGTTWRGGSLPAEFTPRKYVRGSLGMPRNEDPDSGGSQFFVTHRATPHLDGRYTIFGELREGFDVLDRIEVGDRILRVAFAYGAR